MGWQRVDQVLDLLFPPRCLLCGATLAPARPAPACPGCLGDLPWLEAAGAAPLPRPPAAAGAEVRAALLYKYPVDRLVAAAKFGRQLAVARGLGQLLDAGLPAPAEPPDAVVPVPLHWRREAERGFNQAGEIARALCERRGWPFRPGLCRRVRATAAQSGLDAEQRQVNLREAFALVDAAAARWRHVLVVDDVLTTGATVAAVAGLFRRAGVPRLSAWVVAWTPPGRQVARKV